MGIMKNPIIRDTFFLTAVELVMQGLSLLLNAFITRNLGSDTIGIMSLIGSFFMFITIISCGNVYLSTSRFVAEEIGKKCGDPGRIFRYGAVSSLLLSSVTGTIIFALSDVLSCDLLDTPELATGVKLLGAILPMCAINSCFKGYFNAFRNVIVPSVGGVIDFVVKSVFIVYFTGYMITEGSMSVYTAFAYSICAGQIACFVYMLISYIKKRGRSSGKCSISFRQFVVFSIPIFMNSLVTSVLSSTNDALVPITLKQYGNSTSEAFSQFGIFEAIVIPALFFPSSILCSLSGILVPELSRERGADNHGETKRLINRVLRQAFGFAVVTAVIFMCFGDEIGYLLSGGHFAGKVITVLAPAVPFIYLEIILEGILKGMGRHVFSSVNYLVEYTIRITVLLVCVPIFGFYGIVASYLASNIIGNTSRMVMILKITGLRFEFTDNIFIPVLSGLISAEAAEIAKKLLPDSLSTPLASTVILSGVVLVLYVFVCKGAVELIKPRRGEV